jgi:hypothetical protein
MKELKEEFSFSYKGQGIEVKLLNEVYCAIFGEVVKPIKISVSREVDDKHHGRITTWEGKFLSFIPGHAFVDLENKRASVKALKKAYNLPLFCEICLSDKKEILEVHHIKEFAISKGDNKENLRVYCSTCHLIVHNIRTLNRRSALRFSENLTTEKYQNELNKK